MMCHIKQGEKTRRVSLPRRWCSFSIWNRRSSSLPRRPSPLLDMWLTRTGGDEQDLPPYRRCSLLCYPHQKALHLFAVITFPMPHTHTPCLHSSTTSGQSASSADAPAFSATPPHTRHLELKHGGNRVETVAQIYGLASPEPTTGSRIIPSLRGPQRPRRRTRHRGGCLSSGLHAGGRSDAATVRGHGSAPRSEPPHRRRFPSGRGLRWCSHRPRRAGRAVKGGRGGGCVYERISGGGRIW